MADLESRVDKLEGRASSIEVTVEKLSQKMDDFISEMKDFKTEMRDRDNQRAAEIARADEKFEKLREKHESDMHEINKKIDDKFDSLSKEIRSMAMTTIFGVGAIIIAVMGFSWAIFAPSNSAPVQIQQTPAQTTQIQTAQ